MTTERLRRLGDGVVEHALAKWILDGLKTVGAKLPPLEPMVLWHLTGAAVLILGSWLFVLRRHVPAPLVVVLTGRFEENQFHAQLVSSLALELGDRGFECSIKPPASRAGLRHPHDRLEGLLRDRARGIGVVWVSSDGPGACAPLWQQSLATSRKPCVIADSNPLSDLSSVSSKVAFVGTDNTRGGQLAADALASCIRRTSDSMILLMGSLEQVERQRGFIERFAELMPAVRIVVEARGDFSRDEARYLTDLHLAEAARSRRSLVGVFATSDLMAFGVEDAILRTLQRRIPIVGFDGTPDARRRIDASAGLLVNTVVQDTDLIAARIARVMADLLKGRQVERVHLIEPHLYRPAPTRGSLGGSARRAS